MSEARQRGVWIALGVAMLMALATGLTVTTFLDVSDTLHSDVFTALTRPEPQRDPGEFFHGDGHEVTEVTRGMQLAVLGLLLGAVPVALLSAALMTYGRRSRGTPWSGGWGSVFLAGFVFQLSSLGFSALFLGLFLWYALDVGAPAQEVAPYGGFFGVSLLCSVAGLRFWRELQRGVHVEPMTIAPVRHVPTAP